MTDRPILFSAPMVRALLAGTKTQTRRIAKPRKGLTIGDLKASGISVINETFPSSFVALIPNREQIAAPPIEVGDRLWVRESFSYDSLEGVVRHMPCWYWADGNPTYGDWTKPKPSIFLPRWASRLTLEVTGVKVERLQDISVADIIAEGTIEALDGSGLDVGFATAVIAYAALWDSINGPGSWVKNLWVYAYTFAVTRDNIDG